SHGVHARGRMLEVKSNTGKLLFSADDHEVVVGAERLRVLVRAHPPPTNTTTQPPPAHSIKPSLRLNE
ncbi:delta-sarcoglycan isoform X1, partial [Tachysurus ichikawai]